jgi:hypothetical protein
LAEHSSGARMESAGSLQAAPMAVARATSTVPDMTSGGPSRGSDDERAGGGAMGAPREPPALPSDASTEDT